MLPKTAALLGSAVMIIFVIAAIAIVFLQNINTPFPLVEEFEQDDGQTDFGSWTPSEDVPPDPDNPGSQVQWHIRRVSNVSRSGSHSAEFLIDGTQDDGTIWLQRKVSLKPDVQARLTVSFWLYSETESFNTIAAVVAYAGAAQPVSEEDFTVIGSANEAAGWKNYQHTADVTTGSNGEAYVALGISVRWETYMTYYIDDIVID